MKYLTAFLAIGAMSLLAACNTTRGVGEDVEAAGEGIQEVAEDAEEKLKESTD